MGLDLAAATPTGIGSLPHRDPRRAAEFVLAATPELPFVPSLPRRSPAESMVAQAVVGIQGFTVGQYGNLAVDTARIDPAAPVATSLDSDAYEGMRAFLDIADAATPVVKWQIVGPVTLGLALVRAGVATDVAFDVAAGAVRDHVVAVHDRVARHLPQAQHLVFLDEPMLTDLQDPAFPLRPAAAIDLVSGALAVIDAFGTSGVHCCGDGDWASIIAAGPGVLSMPVQAGLVGVAGYLARFLERGGWIAWGVVDPGRPIPTSPELPWRDLSHLWADLVTDGCDPALLSRHALVTPACGLFTHAEAVAARVFRLVRALSERLGAHEWSATAP